MREHDEHEYFTERVAPLLGPDVEYVGEVGGELKRRLLAEAVCLLNPIAWPEPFGMVMIEALACGTPVVTTPHGAAPEIVDDGVTGFLCDDMGQLIERIPAVRELDRRACRASAEHRFGMQRMVSEHLALFEQILGTSMAA
jgi:glycosyltransferase involved in cell wall biosynthesis